MSKILDCIFRTLELEKTEQEENMYGYGSPAPIQEILPPKLIYNVIVDDVSIFSFPKFFSLRTVRWDSNEV